MLVIIDNYDSFVYNLARYFQRLGQETRVVRNDSIGPDAIRRIHPDALILSPGPCTPNEAGASLDIVRELSSQIPMFGVCLGHQTIAAAFGGSVVRASQPCHGRVSEITHTGRGLFQGLPNPITACRYHSLVVDRHLPNILEVTAWSDDVPVMAIEHQEYPVYGVQFHPESILSDAGFAILANFLRLAGCNVPNKHRLPQGELAVRPSMSVSLPNMPVTF
ncbi:MAG: aminodeoxychorismate/anthranilate synthase component II [Pirellulales bacterium]|nr:aminodeoxychorismate/anthranilate synthase component II [Pirellulales bacterium]